MPEDTRNRLLFLGHPVGEGGSKARASNEQGRRQKPNCCEKTSQHLTRGEPKFTQGAPLGHASESVPAHHVQVG